MLLCLTGFGRGDLAVLVQIQVGKGDRGAAHLAHFSLLAAHAAALAHAVGTELVELGFAEATILVGIVFLQQAGLAVLAYVAQLTAGIGALLDAVLAEGVQLVLGQVAVLVGIHVGKGGLCTCHAATLAGHHARLHAGTTLTGSAQGHARTDLHQLFVRDAAIAVGIDSGKVGEGAGIALGRVGDHVIAHAGVLVAIQRAIVVQVVGLEHGTVAARHGGQCHGGGQGDSTGQCDRTDGQHDATLFHGSSFGSSC